MGDEVILERWVVVGVGSGGQRQEEMDGARDEQSLQGSMTGPLRHPGCVLAPE